MIRSKMLSANTRTTLSDSATMGAMGYIFLVEDNDPHLNLMQGANFSANIKLKH
jgi:hypothetical protein